ncbi:MULTISPECIES: NAD(P)-dependent oxidoreductase [unclassified Nocardia]|uniref:NAD(P)-dependent oxidoreductase n=1 Tax=unclassified Nocardia TaxID=2637762 RepID=UPI0033A5FDBA
MRIAVFGAGGAVGSRVVAEALARGHEVTAVARRAVPMPAGVRLLLGDASSAEQVERLAAGQDLVVAATRPAPGSEAELPVVAAAMLAGVARAGARLLVVGGAATLVVPGVGLPLHETAEFPAELAAIAQACAEQLAICRADGVADWTYLSPPADLAPGVRTGVYRIGTDELLVDADGASVISMEDFAVALLDEAERPAHRQARFTVAAS